MSMCSRDQLVFKPGTPSRSVASGYTNGTSHLSSAGRAKGGTNRGTANWCVARKEITSMQRERNHFFGSHRKNNAEVGSPNSP